MKTPRYEIQYQYGQELFIKPFFDVHWGATACDEKAFLQDLKETDENTYLLFGGDLFDSILPSDRRYRKSTDKTITEAIIDECLDEMVEVLKQFGGVGRVMEIRKLKNELGKKKVKYFDGEFEAAINNMLNNGYIGVKKIIAGLVVTHIALVKD